jgi:Protein of unknown function (DUF3800)
VPARAQGRGRAERQALPVKGYDQRQIGSCSCSKNVSGEVFVKIVVYADESGTHDKNGTERGSEVAVVAGYAAKVDSWTKFCKDWRAVLKAYSAPYFHFNEFADASAVARNKRPPTSRHKNNPYSGWAIDQLDNFLFDLAKVAAAGSRVPVAGYVDTRGYAGYLKQMPEEKMRNPHAGCVWWFYESALQGIQAKWPRLQWPITFIFDQTASEEWRSAITSAHLSYQKLNSRIKAIAFANKKDPEHYPLQAADLLAYRLRQIAGKYCKYDSKIPQSMPKLGFIREVPAWSYED